MRKRTWLAVAVTVALLVLLWVLRSWGFIGPYGAGQLVLRPCFDPALRGGRCGSYYTYENRVARSGRLLALNLIVLPARGPAPAEDPIFFLAGGPGAAATGYADTLADSPLRQRRDIVLVDQRGTGQSNGLDCPQGGIRNADLQAVLDAILLFDLGDVAACRDQLSTRADLSQYTTPIAMDDLDEVRSALGYGRINLYGGSYGTRAAQVYLREHPQSTRAVVLRGVAPMPLRIPQDMTEGSEEALSELFADCRRTPRCRQAFRAPARELSSLLERLEAVPAAVSVEDPRSHQQVTITFTRDHLAETLRLMLYDADSASLIPAYLHAAAGGDFTLLAQEAATSSAKMAARLRLGMFLSVVCAEDAPFLSPAEELIPEGPLFSRRRQSNVLSACSLWPRGELPAGYKRNVSSEVPVLLISGAVDPITPAFGGAKVARHLPHSLHLVLPAMGHAPMLPGCTATLADQFLDRGTVEGLDASCLAGLARPLFLLPTQISR